MKITTKLLLGVTVVVGLSVSVFGACASNVDMGNKQLKNVADGSDAKDAVNVTQVLQAQVLELIPNSDVNVTNTYDGYNAKITKIGSVCILGGTLTLNNVPKLSPLFTNWPTSGSFQSTHGEAHRSYHGTIVKEGAVSPIYAHAGTIEAALNSGTHYRLSMTYPCTNR